MTLAVFFKKLYISIRHCTTSSNIENNANLSLGDIFKLLMYKGSEPISFNEGTKIYLSELSLAIEIVESDMETLDKLLNIISENAERVLTACPKRDAPTNILIFEVEAARETIGQQYSNPDEKLASASQTLNELFIKLPTNTKQQDKIVNKIAAAYKSIIFDFFTLCRNALENSIKKWVKTRTEGFL